MGLRMKNFNIFGGSFWCSLKNPILGGGSRKTNVEGKLPKKGGLGQYADLRGAW